MDEPLHRLSKLFQAMGNGIRLELLVNLKDDRKNVSELAEITNRSINSVSHHLRTLRDNNLVESETKGKQRIYWLKRPTLVRECLAIKEFLERESQ